METIAKGMRWTVESALFLGTPGLCIILATLLIWAEGNPAYGLMQEDGSVVRCHVLYPETPDCADYSYWAPPWDDCFFERGPVTTRTATPKQSRIYDCSYE